MVVIRFCPNTGTSISCYSCNSRNRTHTSCHDPIHPENTSYIEHCKVPKENHNGLFPAYYCVKMIGISKITGEQIVIRYCSLENMDNQCGAFKFMDEPFEGCILTCTYDGCNAGFSLYQSRMTGMLQFCSLAISLLLTMPRTWGKG